MSRLCSFILDSQARFSGQTLRLDSWARLLGLGLWLAIPNECIPHFQIDCFADWLVRHSRENGSQFK